jgi:iron complex transport system permease protein
MRHRNLIAAPWARRRRVRPLAIGAAVLGLVVVASLALGARDLDPVAVVRALAGMESSSDAVVVWQLRMPRTLLAIAVGIGLGLAGMLMQGVTRNPIADPGILGVSAGASVAVVLAIAFLGVTDPGAFLICALLGAAVASVIVQLLGASGGGRLSPIRITLAGAVLSAFLAAITSAVLVLDDATLERFRFWEVGSLAGRDAGTLVVIVPVLAAGTLIALLLARSLDALALGDDVATALGQRVMLIRVAATTGVVLLAGAAVAAAGPIVFVGLAVPHAARAIAGQDARWIAAWCLLLGPILVLAADVTGRVVLRPSELPVGVVTALIGVPVLILLVRRTRTVSA